MRRTLARVELIFRKMMLLVNMKSTSTAYYFAGLAIFGTLVFSWPYSCLANSFEYMGPQQAKVIKKWLPGYPRRF
jgi:hypothetical protein